MTIRAHKNISSMQNPLFRDLLRLSESRERIKKGRFGTEGLREIRKAIDCGYRLLQLWFAPEKLSAEASTLIKEQFPATQADRQPALLVSSTEACLSKLLIRQNSDPLFAVFESPAEPSPDRFHKEAEEALLLVLEGIEKPGNIGAAFRSADGAAATGIIIVSDSPVDMYHPNIIRNSLGTVFSTPFITMTAESLFHFLETFRISSWATSEAREAVSWHQADFHKGTAFFVGSEAHGLSRAVAGRCQHNVRIPMSGSADSLNVSVAAAILLYEARRQRLSSQPHPG